MSLAVEVLTHQLSLILPDHLLHFSLDLKHPNHWSVVAEIHLRDHSVVEKPELVRITEKENPISVARNSQFTGGVIVV